jgi:hypothetical protein
LSLLARACVRAPCTATLCSMRRGALTLILALLFLSPTAALATGSTCNGLPWGAADPCLTLTPSSGPDGTRVQISGRVRGPVPEFLTDRQFHGLLGEVGRRTGGPECEVGAGAEDYQLAIDRNGNVRGSFKVAARGLADCHQTDRRHVYEPGPYVLWSGCHACGFAVFRLTSAGPRSLPYTGTVPITALALAGLCLVTTGLGLTWLGRSPVGVRHECLGT